MHAAQRSFPGIRGKAALFKTRSKAALPELSRTPDARERPAIIDVSLQLDDVRAANLRLAEDHGSTVTAGMGTNSLPPHSLTNAS